ncbi:MAG: glyoxalase superfamily protein [Pseudomonadota bacterium]|nr:glyoxalase superfamily protein [Pseudomonadota bacterium]
MPISIEDLKEQARRLRGSLAESGENISHSRALELVARQHGHRDWNTARAAAGNRPVSPPVDLGGRARGRYLGQPFSGTVIGLRSQLAPGRWEVELRFDEPVDVVSFDSFSAFRSRVKVTLDSDGRTTEKTSNGVPHMVLDLH